MKKRGFTLIELIAVVVVIGIIAVVAVPAVANQIDETRKEAYGASVRGLFDSVNTYIASSDITDYLTTSGIHIPNDKIYKNLDIKNQNFASGRIYLDENQVLHAQNISNGTFCASGTKSNLEVIQGSCDLLDLTAPVIDVSVSRTTSNSITIVVNSSDDESGITTYNYYLNGSLIEQNKNNVYTFNNLKENTTYTIMVKTINGNNMEATKSLKATTNSNDFIWKEEPEGWSKKKTITLSYPNLTGIEKYQYKVVGTTDWVTVTGNKITIEIDKVSTITVRLLKEETIIFTKTKTFAKIDNEAPIINEITGNDDKWTTSKKITVNAVDMKIGLAEKAYSFDGGKTWQESSSKIFTENGIVQIMVKDKLNNITQISSVELTKIDSTIPKAHSITATSDNKNYTSDTWVNKDVILKANPSPSETISGYQYTWYKKNGDSYEVINNENNQTLTISSDGTDTYKVEIMTGASSFSVESSNVYTVKIDTVSPTCSSKKTNLNKTTGVIATFACKDNSSGVVACTSRKLNLKTSKSYTIKDKAGNTGKCNVDVSSKTQYRKRTCSTYKTDGATCGYSCSSGYTLSGTTCSKQVTDTKAAPYNPCLTTTSKCVGGDVETTGYGQCAACGADTSRCKTYYDCSANTYASGAKCFYLYATSKKCLEADSSGSCTNVTGTKWMNTNKYKARTCKSHYYAYCNNCPVSVWSDCASTTSVCNGGYYCDNGYILSGTNCSKTTTSTTSATAKACEAAGCSSWNSYTSWSDDSNNYCSTSNSCQGKTRTVYY